MMPAEPIPGPDPIRLRYMPFPHPPDGGLEVLKAYKPARSPPLMLECILKTPQPSALRRRPYFLPMFFLDYVPVPGQVMLMTNLEGAAASRFSEIIREGFIGSVEWAGLILVRHSYQSPRCCLGRVLGCSDDGSKVLIQGVCKDSDEDDKVEVQMRGFAVDEEPRVCRMVWEHLTTSTSPSCCSASAPPSSSRHSEGEPMQSLHHVFARSMDAVKNLL
eukprot:jgi/Botrbrau1/21842/Bobra.0190s0056.1